MRHIYRSLWRWVSPADRGSTGLNAEAGSGQVEPCEFHDLGPGRDEVGGELLAGVVARVDLGEGPQLRVGAEDEVDRGGRPLQVVGRRVADLVQVLIGLRLRPPGSRRQQVGEEI